MASTFRVCAENDAERATLFLSTKDFSRARQTFVSLYSREMNRQPPNPLTKMAEPAVMDSSVRAPHREALKRITKRSLPLAINSFDHQHQLEGHPASALSVREQPPRVNRQMMRPLREMAAPSKVGVLLLDSQLRPVYHNAEAAQVLTYPRSSEPMPSLGSVLPAARTLLASAAQPSSTVASAIEFRSGRRRYRCRVISLDSHAETETCFQAKVVVLLERECSQSIEITRRSDKYRLTRRERETVRLLLQGLTSKEIAHQMQVSPSTIKSFLKMVMVKVGASNRAGIVAKLLE
jgi:DNA-binding CsgD family transcriptional regulator